MAATATGTITRVQMQRVGQVLTPHGNLTTYDPHSGNFTVLFDFQQVGQPPYEFTRDTQAAAPSTDPNAQGLFVDQYGEMWQLIR